MVECPGLRSEGSTIVVVAFLSLSLFLLMQCLAMGGPIHMSLTLVCPWSSFCCSPFLRRRSWLPFCGTLFLILIKEKADFFDYWIIALILLALFYLSYIW